MHLKLKIQTQLLLTLLLLSALLLAQCGFGEAEPTPMPPVELNWATFQENSAVEVELMKQYRSMQPQVTFRRTSGFPGQTDLDATPASDIVNTLVNYDFLLASKEGKLADLSEVWASGGLEVAVPRSLQALTTYEGKQFFIPTALNWTGVFYNKSVFEQYSLQPPQTWDELVQLCDTLLINNEVPFAIAGNGYSTLLWFDILVLRVGGMQFYRDLLDGKESYTDNRVQEAIDRWQVLIARGCFVEKAQNYNDQQALLMLVRDDQGVLGRTKAVMIIADAFNYTQLPLKFRNEMDFFRFPQVKTDVPLAELMALTGYAVPVKAAHSAQAIDFVSFLASQEAQAKFAQEAFINSSILAPVRNDISKEGLTADTVKAMAMINESEAAAPLSFLWAPTDLTIQYQAAYRKLLSKDWDFVGFIEMLEETRLKAVESGLLVR